VQSIAWRRANEPAVRAAEPSAVQADPYVASLRASEPAAVRSERPIAAVRAAEPAAL
jgi:hypothetical protein